MTVNIKAVVKYDPHDFKKVPFLEKLEDGKIMNGHFDVTEVPRRLKGIKKGDEEIRLKDYLVYRPLPTAMLKLSEKPEVHPQSYDMQMYYSKITDAITNGVTIGGEYYNPMFMLWIILFIFEIPLYDKKGNLLEGFDIGKPLYSNVDRYIIDCMWKAYKNKKHIAFMAGRGVGKDQSVSTLIPTPIGMREMGSLKIGEHVYTAAGEITRIKNIKNYDTKEMYDVRFADGRETNCGTGHLWNVYEHNELGIRTVEAIDIHDNLTYKNHDGEERARYSVPISRAVEFVSENLETDPYTMGYYIGNHSAIAENEGEYIDGILAEIRKSYEYGCESLVSIPEKYMYSSIGDRMDLVRGMMDSLGYVMPGGKVCGYTNDNVELVDDLAWILRSLGIKCAKVDQEWIYAEGPSKIVHALYIYTGLDIFAAPEENEKIAKDNVVSIETLLNRYRTGIVDMTLRGGLEPSRCIEVEDPSGTYLTEDFTVTHNSFITDSVMAWFYVMFDKQELIVSATSDPIVEEAWSKFTDTIDLIEEEYPGYNQKRITNSTIKILAGEEYYDEIGNKKKRGSLNEVRRIVYGDNPNVTRGRRPHFQHIEEFASFPAHPSKGSLKNCLGQSKGSWKVQGSIVKAFVIMTGTGGSVNNKDAEDVFTNPEGFNLFVIEEWGKKTGIFIPTYLKYGGTWEHTGVPNISLAMDLVVKSRKMLESDPVAYSQELQEFPITLDEVFITRGFNIFNQDKIGEMIAKLTSTAKKPWKEGRIDYILDSEGNVTGVKFVEVAGGKIIIVEEPETEEDGKVLNNLYVAGVDSIDQGNNDSLYDGSKLACTVKKRQGKSMFATTSNIYVCFYNERSDNVLWDYENVLKISMLYNAKVNVEYTKINIISFFREKKQFWRLLKRPSIAIGSNVSGIKASQLIGTPATASVIVHQDQKLAAFIEEYYYHILYLPAVEQLRDYDAKNRTKFDFVVAMGLTELADEDLMGKPATDGGSASEDLKPFGMYRDENGRKRWGEIPDESQKEIQTIALEETLDNRPFRWVESTDI